MRNATAEFLAAVAAVAVAAGIIASLPNSKPVPKEMVFEFNCFKNGQRTLHEVGVANYLYRNGMFQIYYADNNTKKSYAARQGELCGIGVVP